MKKILSIILLVFFTVGCEKITTPQSNFDVNISPPYETIPITDCMGIEGVESCDMILHTNNTKITWIMRMDVKQMYVMLGKYIKEKSSNITNEQLIESGTTRQEFDNTINSMINGSIIE